MVLGDRRKRVLCQDMVGVFWRKTTDVIAAHSPTYLGTPTFYLFRTSVTAHILDMVLSRLQLYGLLVYVLSYTYERVGSVWNYQV